MTIHTRKKVKPYHFCGVCGKPYGLFSRQFIHMLWQNIFPCHIHGRDNEARNRASKSVFKNDRWY